MMRLMRWQGGEKNRKLRICRPCDCRTCKADKPEEAVGFMSWSGPDGNGFTLWIDSEDVYQDLVAQIGETKR